MADPLLMGILNVTPDSFSDGGLHFDPSVAIAAGLRMIEEGADYVDVGGESTRPGAAPVGADEEIRRTLPVVEALARSGARVSIDTMKAEVARAALQAGAVMVNDVTALGDPAMGPVVAEARADLCLMHMQGEPRTMQKEPRYEDVVAEVRDFLIERAALAESHGVARERIWIDPGICFGKTLEHNLALLRNLDRFIETGYRVMIGVSRKSFLGMLSGGASVDRRLAGTLAAQTLAQVSGVAMIRAHDIPEARQAIDVAAAILGEGRRER